MFFGPRQNPNNPYAAVIPIFMDKALNDTILQSMEMEITSRDLPTLECNSVKFIYFKQISSFYD